MTILCKNCGSALTTDVNFCPKCGTPTPSYYSHSGSSQVDPTAIASSGDAIYQKASTDYGSPPYGTPDKNSYDLLNPYGTIPPPPPQHRTRFSLLVGIVSGVAVSILILGSVGAFVLLTQKAKYSWAQIRSEFDSGKGKEVSCREKGRAIRRRKQE